MRIDTGYNLFNLNQTSKSLNKTFNQLSSGRSINSASDDPAGLALVTSLASAVTDLRQTNRNISYDSANLDTESGALSSTSDSLQRMREIAVQSANGNLNSNDRAGLQQEYDQLVQDVNQLNPNLNLGLTPTGVATQSSAQDALQSIDSAMAQVNGQQASIGAERNANDFTSDANAIQAENLEAARSQAGDADYAALASDLAMQQIQQKAQIQVLKVQMETQKTLTSKLFGS
jgi:flagellin